MTDDLLTTTRDDLRAWDVPRHVPLVALRSTHVFPLGVAAVQVTSGTSRGRSSTAALARRCACPRRWRRWIRR
jgi:hypothetical protein